MTTWIWLGVALLWLGTTTGLARRQDERWKDLSAGGLLALFVVAFFWRTLSGDVFQPADGGDLVSFLYPTYRFAASVIQTGHLPLWNPTLYGGAPFISDIQAGFLYPPNLLLFWLRPDFPYTWMQWLAIGHLWWAGLGVYVLGRVVGFSRPASLLAGTAFALSDPLFIHLGNLNLIAVLAWTGWILAAFHLSLARRQLGWAVVAAVLFAVANYAGHAQSSYFVAMAVGVYAVVWGIWGSGAGDWGSGIGVRVEVLKSLNRPIAQSLLSLFTVAVLTFLLSAPILLPALEIVPYTARAEFNYQDSVGFSLAPVPGIVGLLTPGFFGRGPALHWSLWDRVELPYAGVPVLLLAVGALLLPGDRRKWPRLLPWIVLAIFGFVVALGIYTPVHGWLTQLVPGFAQFRAPARAIVLFTLAMSMLAAAGMDALLFHRKGAEGQIAGGKLQASEAQPVPRNPQSTIRHPQFTSFLRWGGLVLLIVGLPAVYASLLFLQEDSTAFLRASLAGLAVTLATASWLGTWLLVTLWQRGKLTARIFAVLVIGLLLVELSSAGSYTDVAETNPATNFHHPEIIDFFQKNGATSIFPSRQFPVHSPQYRIDTKTGIDALWQPDTAALVGLEDVGGIVNPLMLRHWDELWNSLGGRDTRRYDMLNVRYVIVQDGTPLPEEFVLAFDAPGPLAVYENPDPLPRVWFGEGGDWGSGSGEWGPVIDADQSPDRLITNLTISSPSVNELIVTGDSSNVGYFFFSEVWYPGWRAMVNGEETPVLRVAYALRAVAVPAGEVTVHMWFAPSSWRWGLGLFGVGMFVVFGILWTRIRRNTDHQGMQ
ncbi:hypothetical protein GC175_19560 [bacterium]|nr:hypothetical protein [bacterium]